MTQFLGEYEIKMDDKGRISFPANLRRQVSQEAQEKFVLKKGFEDCLALYPFDEWKKIGAELNKLSPWVKKNRDFIRSFSKGVIEVQLDNASRIQIPKRLLDLAGIEKECVLFAHGNCVEIWSKQKFEHMHEDMDADEMAKLAEEVMGNMNVTG